MHSISRGGSLELPPKGGGVPLFTNPGFSVVKGYQVFFADTASALWFLGLRTVVTCDREFLSNGGWVVPPIQ